MNLNDASHHHTAIRFYFSRLLYEVDREYPRASTASRFGTLINKSRVFRWNRFLSFWLKRRKEFVIRFLSRTVDWIKPKVVFKDPGCFETTAAAAAIDRRARVGRFGKCTQHYFGRSRRLECSFWKAAGVLSGQFEVCTISNQIWLASVVLWLTWKGAQRRNIVFSRVDVCEPSRAKMAAAGSVREMNGLACANSCHW